MKKANKEQLQLKVQIKFTKSLNKLDYINVFPRCQFQIILCLLALNLNEFGCKV